MHWVHEYWQFNEEWPLNSHIDYNFLQLNSIYILWKCLQKTVFTPLRMGEIPNTQSPEEFTACLRHPKLTYFGPHFLWLLHVCKRRGKKRAGQNKHAIHHKGGTGKGKHTAPEHQSTWTVPTVNPCDPPSDGNDYKVLTSFPQMWQCSRGRTEDRGQWKLEEKDRCLLPKKI